MPGTKSRGCHAKLIGSNRSMEAHNIRRDGGLLFVREEIMFGDGDAVPEDILVFDWESDDSIGKISVPVNILRTPNTIGPSGLQTGITS